MHIELFFALCTLGEDYCHFEEEKTLSLYSLYIDIPHPKLW